MRSKYVSHSGAILGGYIQNNEHLFVYSYLSIITPNRYSRRSLLFKMVHLMFFFHICFHYYFLLTITMLNTYYLVHLSIDILTQFFHYILGDIDIFHYLFN